MFWAVKILIYSIAYKIWLIKIQLTYICLHNSILQHKPKVFRSGLIV
jgi:hypothetical protein